MSTVLLLSIYCGAILLASLAGGWLPTVMRLDHRRMQIALSFVAGVMLGIGLLHLVPHAFYELRSMDATVAWVLGGFMGMFFLERFFQFHHHDVPDDQAFATAEPALEAAVQDHGHLHLHGHHHGGATHSHSFLWGGAAVGLTLHSMIDGVALAAAVAAEQDHGHLPVWAGLGTFLAVVLHKPFDSLTIGTLMRSGGRSGSHRLLVNILFALTVPLGVFLFHLGMTAGHTVLGYALAFAGGAFLCIATSDLLPELQFHSHDRGKLSLALLLGIGLAWAIVLAETHGHDVHQHGNNVPDTHGHHDHD